jgi:hypothetical protein
MERLEKVENDSLIQARSKAPTMKDKPRDGHKFIKTRILSADGDLEWGIIEVPSNDKRKAYDPRQEVASKTDVVRGNPMADKPIGKNDVVVTGV